MPGVHLVAFCTIMAIARQEEARRRHYTLLLPNEFLVHSTIDSLCTPGLWYMHNLDDKYPTRPGFEPRNPEFRATTGSNEL